MRLFGPDFFHLCTRHLRITLQIEMHGPFLLAERRADGSWEGAYLGDHLSIARSPTPAGCWWICDGLVRPDSPEPLICLEEHDAVVALGIAHMLGIKGVDQVPRQLRGSPAWASLLREMAAAPSSAETWSRGDYRVKDWWNAALDDILVAFPDARVPRRHRDVSLVHPKRCSERENRSRPETMRPGRCSDPILRGAHPSIPVSGPLSAFAFRPETAISD